jgi:hypothetical protein
MAIGSQDIDNPQGGTEEAGGKEHQTTKNP